MRKELGVKTLIYPQPVLIIATYDENGIANAMNAAWGGISEENQVTICISNTHKTAENLINSRAFTLSVGTFQEMTACDYVGIVSGKKNPDKFKQAGWTPIKSQFVNAPLIDKLPLALECIVISYDTETCCLKGEIINVSADESILTNGKVDPLKLRAIAFDPDNNNYLEITGPVGKAFSIGKVLK